MATERNTGSPAAGTDGGGATNSQGKLILRQMQMGERLFRQLARLATEMTAETGPLVVWKERLAKLDAAEAQITELHGQARLSSAQAASAEVERALSGTAARYLRHDVERTNQEVAADRAAAAEQEAELERWKITGEALRYEVARLRVDAADVKRLRRANAGLTMELRRVSEQARQDASELARAVASAKTELGAVQEEKNGVSRQLRTMTEDVQALRARLDGSAADNADLQRQIQRAVDENESLQAELRRREQRIQQDAEQLKQRADLDATAEVERATQKLLARLAEVDAFHESKTKQLAEEARKTARLSLRVAELSADASNLRDALQQARHEADRCRMENLELKDRVRSLGADVAHWKEDAETSSIKLEERAGDLTRAEDAIAALKLRTSEDAEVARLAMEERDRTAAALGEMRKEHDARAGAERGTKEQLTQELLSALGRVEDLTGQRNRLEEALSTTKRSLGQQVQHFTSLSEMLQGELERRLLELKAQKTAAQRAQQDVEDLRASIQQRDRQGREREESLAQSFVQERARVSNEFNALQRRLTELEGEKRESFEDAAARADELRETRELQQRLEDSLRRRESELEQASERNERANAEKLELLEELKKASQRDTVRNDAHRREVLSLTDRLSELELEVKKAKTAAAAQEVDVKTQNESLSIELRATQRKLALAQQEVRAVQAEAEGRDRELTASRLELAEVRASAGHQDASLCKALREARSRAAAAGRELHDAIIAESRAQAEIQRLASEVRGLRDGKRGVEITVHGAESRVTGLARFASPLKGDARITGLPEIGVTARAAGVGGPPPPPPAASAAVAAVAATVVAQGRRSGDERARAEVEAHLRARAAAGYPQISLEVPVPVDVDEPLMEPGMTTAGRVASTAIRAGRGGSLRPEAKVCVVLPKALPGAASDMDMISRSGAPVSSCGDSEGAFRSTAASIQSTANFLNERRTRGHGSVSGARACQQQNSSPPTARSELSAGLPSLQADARTPRSSGPRAWSRSAARDGVSFRGRRRRGHDAARRR